MKKYILIVFVISLMFVAISSSAFMITRDSLDHVEIVMAMKGEVCNIENPGCDEPQGDEPIEENTTTALPWDERFDLSAACLRQKMDELDCQGEAKDMIFGQFATFMKNGTEGGKFWSSDIVVIINDNVYGPGMMTAGYWRANDTYKTINFSAGGHYAYMPGEAEHPYKFMGLKYLAFSQPHRFDPDIQPYGSERVNPGFILIYYDEDGTLNIYAHLKENYYKMTSVKKKVENKTWTPPPEPEVPSPEPRQVEIPKKIDVPTPIPPPPIYLPGMPETADPKKEHVIPNCNSQGASVCRQDEECPDKWIKAKEDRCCSVICTPVGKKEIPPSLEKKNETETNETEKNKTKEEKPEESITNKTCPECQEPSQWSDCIDNQQNRTKYYCNETTNYTCEPYTETKDCQRKVEISLSTDKKTYKKGENVSIALVNNEKNIYGYSREDLSFNENLKYYKLESDAWRELTIWSYDCWQSCDNESLNLICPSVSIPTCRKIEKQVNWIWNQNILKNVSKTCGNKIYETEEMTQVDVGTFKIKLDYYSDYKCVSNLNYLETSFNIIE